MSEHERVLVALSSMTVLELSRFVRELEEEWGVSAKTARLPAPVPVVRPDPEPATRTVLVTAVPAKRLDAVRAVRAERPDLSVREASDLLKALPAMIAENLEAGAAEALADRLRAVGMDVRYA